MVFEDRVNVLRSGFLVLHTRMADLASMLSAFFYLFSSIGRVCKSELLMF